MLWHGKLPARPPVHAVGASSLAISMRGSGIAIGVHHDEAVRDEIVAHVVRNARDPRGIALGILDAEVILGRIAAAHALLAQRQPFDVHAGKIVGAGGQFDGVAGIDLSQRVLQRAAGLVVVVAFAGVQRLPARRSACR